MRRSAYTDVSEPSHPFDGKSTAHLASPLLEASRSDLPLPPTLRTNRREERSERTRDQGGEIEASNRSTRRDVFARGVSPLESLSDFLLICCLNPRFLLVDVVFGFRGTDWGLLVKYELNRGG